MPPLNINEVENRPGNSEIKKGRGKKKKEEKKKQKANDIAGRTHPYLPCIRISFEDPLTF
jgi:hypothetical protein